MDWRFLQVGVAACQLSRALGLRVLGTAGTPEGMTLVLNNGAHQAFNHREEDYTHRVMVEPKGGTDSNLELLAACGQKKNMPVCVFQEQTSGRGVDVIVEMLSNVNLCKDLQMLALGGRVVVSGTLHRVLSLFQEMF